MSGRLETQAPQGSARSERAPARRGPLARLFARWKPPRRLKLTREGKYFIGVTFGVGFAAINTGNNLLYLLLGKGHAIHMASVLRSGLTSKPCLLP